jgi:hypothetical protein
MTEKENGAGEPTPLEELQRRWPELALKVEQLKAELSVVEQETKAVRLLLERAIDHILKSHSELVLILTNLVSKLPLNDVGVVVAKLVEHNTNTAHFLAGLGKGGADSAAVSRPAVVKLLDQARRELTAALKPLVDELLRLDTPLERDLLQGFATQPDLYFSPRAVRASRCLAKGYLPRERVIREFGQPALVFFNDLTTDPKLNPRPKQDEVVLGFKDDFEALLAQDTAYPAGQRQELLALYRKVQRSKGASEEARAQRSAFVRLSFVLELLHFYEHPDTEPPDVVFAQRLPGLIEQLALPNPQDPLEEKLLVKAEHLLAFVVNPDHRLMIINNVGKAGGNSRTLKLVLRLRAARPADPDFDQVVNDFVRHLIPAQQPPPAGALVPVLKLLKPELQQLVLRFVLGCDRIRKDEAEALAKALAAELGVTLIAEPAEKGDPVENERRRAWGRIRDLISRRADAAAIAAAIRDRLNTKYDADEIRQSWFTIIEADSIALIRIICQIPYRADGKTDAIARPVIETYVSRLTHEKYAAIYHKVVNSLKRMYQARPDNPTLLTFVGLVRWASPEAAARLCADIGMPAPVP